MSQFVLKNTLFLLNGLLCLCLKINDITLPNGAEYLRLQDEEMTTLFCNFELSEGETLKQVSWSHNSFGIYFWNADSPPDISEDYTDGSIIKTISDPHLHIKKVSMGISGTYKCKVTLASGQQTESYTFQLLIVDMPDHPITSNSKIEECILKFSWGSPAINPKPTPMCGVWSEQYGFTRTATSWLATPYYNGSISYRLVDEIFDISYIPLDSLIKCEISIRKIDRSKVSLISKDYTFDQISERGCPRHVEDSENVQVEYENFAHTCHNEIKPKNKAAGPAIERRKCKDGFEPKYADFVASVELLCDGQEWKVGGGQTWDHVSNLLCVPIEVYKAPLIPSTPAPIERKRAEDFADTSSGVSLFPWTYIILLCVLGSGAICGLKWIIPRKKSSRFMD